MSKEEKDSRKSWDQYFMEMALHVGSRTTCLRRPVGAVLVKEKRVLATGYNGAPAGFAHCSETGCIREKLKIPSGERHELCRGVHAEQNAVVQSARFGVAIKDSTVYTTTFPCVICAKILINAGITTVVYLGGYQDALSEKMLKEESEMVLVAFPLEGLDPYFRGLVR